MKAAVTNFEEDLARSVKIFPPKCVTPLSSNYEPWLEDYPKPMTEGVQRYQELIRHLRWSVEIGCLEILLETLMLSSYIEMPWVGHLNQSFNIFGYLKAHLKRKLGFDLAHPAINENRFHQCDCTDFYRDAEEVIPRNMPVARGKFMSTHFF